MPRHPRRSIDTAIYRAWTLGFKTREIVYDDGEIMVDVEGFGELIELYYKPNAATGYLNFKSAFMHGGHGGGDRIRAWKRVSRLLHTISTDSRCDHYETNTQPGECTDCVCADCGAWVGSAECRRNEGGRCDKCIAAELDEES